MRSRKVSGLSIETGPAAAYTSTRSTSA